MLNVSHYQEDMFDPNPALINQKSSKAHGFVGISGKESTTIFTSFVQAKNVQEEEDNICNLTIEQGKDCVAVIWSKMAYMLLSLLLLYKEDLVAICCCDGVTI